MKQRLNLLGLLSIGVLGGSLFGLTSSAKAQSTLRLNYDTSSFENLQLTGRDIGVRVSYTHHSEMDEQDENNLSYQLLYGGEKQEAVDTLAWTFAEFQLQDLDSDGTEEIIVRNYSGGAHCCTNTTIHRWTGEAFSSVETGYLDGIGPDIADVNGDGYVEMAVPHQAFLYRFGSYAESFPPVTFFTYRDGELVDATRQFPERIREQIETLQSVFVRVREEDDYISNSLLASYVAQHAVLNEDFDAAWQFMLDNYDREATWGLQIYEDGEQMGTHPDFPSALRAFLIEISYLGENGLPIAADELG